MRLVIWSNRLHRQRRRRFNDRQLRTITAKRLGIIAFAFALLVAAESRAQLTSNLIAVWQLNSVLTDPVGGFTLTNNNSVSFAAGNFGNAASFDGTSSRNLSVSGLTMSGSVTMACWAKFNTTDFSGNDASIAHIIGKDRWGDGSNGHYRLSAESGNIEVAISTGGGATFYEAGWALSNITTATWYHLAYVYNSAGNTLKLYVNGVERASVGTVGSVVNVAQSFAIGAFPNNEAHTAFNGLIDEAGVWSRALSVAEITQLYNSGNGFAYPWVTPAAHIYRRQLSRVDRSIFSPLFAINPYAIAP